METNLSLSKNAGVILEKRYLKKDSHGNLLETPINLFERVAKSIASADLIYDTKANVKNSEKKFLRLLNRRWFLPNSPTLMNAGRHLGQLAACFVLPIEDSLESIFETLKNTALIHKSGGGTGFSFSNIRPEKDLVVSTTGVSSGPISFMSVFNAATEAVKQGGARRGANMGLLRVDHPDIEAFILCKNDLSQLNNFNISVALSEKFMEALRTGADYDLINPRTGRSVRSVPAKKIFDQMVYSAWQTGEPGIIFIDRINEYNPTPQLGRIEATNPCGEQPLLAYESCTLGSINLSAMVTGNRLDIDLLKKTVHDAVHFLDNVIDVNKYPLARIAKMSRGTRKIGLGVMGFADMLIKLKVPYDSDEAVNFAEKVMAHISHESKEASSNLAKRRGNFPYYKGSIFDNAATPYMRNATTTTIAPTGTISIIADTSSGIEPIFAVAYVRRVLDKQRLYEINPLFIDIAEKEGFYSKKILKEIARTGSVAGVRNIPDWIKKLFKISHEISPEHHLKIQATFQKYTDNAVSKTINFPANATLEDIKNVYLSAYEMGCKGITIYRYESRKQQVLNIGMQNRDLAEIAYKPRPVCNRSVTQYICSECGRLHVTLDSDQKNIC
ncbi:MAG: vitamin B12-dependent ribonucleotide reductase [Desulfobacterales bacterium]|nr:vitamin B12-dependent ribonucleotide reductase [Desulfobacterales bacterium]